VCFEPAVRKLLRLANIYRSTKQGIFPFGLYWRTFKQLINFQKPKHLRWFASN